MSSPAGRRAARPLAVGLAAVIVAIGAYAAVASLTTPRRTTPIHDPPVLAGQHLWASCSAGFYARTGTTIVLTSSGHCAGEGTVAHDPDGRGVRGVFGPAAWSTACPHPGKRCAGSDMNYLIVEPDRIPWGRLNQVDLGTGGYRTIPKGARPMTCDDIEVGDPVEMDGRNIYRTGTVLEKGEYLHEEDGDYFPCIVAADVQVAVGDSGAGVLVRGIPAGVTSRSFNGLLGFTPLAEGLEDLGLELCTDPNCGLDPT